ncbi:hypothetical protein N0V88_000700 [Collariella sp. IMI 366227]|nr:hypothetical protein N0V88_000700 [Collariella sp. IMI 366227]
MYGSYDLRSLADSLAESGELDMGRFAASEALDCLNAYYKVALKRFINDVAVEVIEAKLMSALDRILPPGSVLNVAIVKGVDKIESRERTDEAVAWIHAHRVLHCDIQPTNLLLDKDLHVKLSDFQGKLLAEDGTVLVDGYIMEPYRFSLPRDNFRADVKTDLFALGCTLYFILLGHTIFPDIGDRDEEAWEKVEQRLAKKEWPREQQVCSAVTVKCWEQQYESTEDVVRDLESIEREHG